MPLRLFLGVTFLFAGLQKLANPAFFRSSSPISIHAQLAGSAQTSPIHALVSHLVPVASAVGATIAVGEVAIGVGILVGLWMRVAAIAGMALSFGLFLTVSFHSSPYFTGSDIVFFFAWTPLALAGAAGAPALDTWVRLSSIPAEGIPAPEDGLPRRAVLSKGALTGFTAAVVVVASGSTVAFGRAGGGSPSSADGEPTLSGGTGDTTTSSDPATGTTGTTGTTAPVTPGTSVGSASGVPVGARPPSPIRPPEPPPSSSNRPPASSSPSTPCVPMPGAPWPTPVRPGSSPARATAPSSMPSPGR